MNTLAYFAEASMTNKKVLCDSIEVSIFFSKNVWFSFFPIEARESKKKQSICATKKIHFFAIV
jgi:hypothetical protein